MYFKFSPCHQVLMMKIFKRNNDSNGLRVQHDSSQSSPSLCLIIFPKYSFRGNESNRQRDEHVSKEGIRGEPFHQKHCSPLMAKTTSEFNAQESFGIQFLSFKIKQKIRNLEIPIQPSSVEALKLFPIKAIQKKLSITFSLGRIQNAKFETKINRSCL